MELFELPRLTKEYPSLNISGNTKDFCVEGKLDVYAEIPSFKVEESFNINLRCKNFPYELPKIFETSNKICNYHVNETDNSLCLDSNFSIISYNVKHLSILKYFNKFVIPFFFSYRYHGTFGVSPYGERKHGYAGLLDEYNALFDTPASISFLLLTYANKALYRGHHLCPCGSKLRLRSCHGPIIRKKFQNYPLSHLLQEIENIAYINYNISLQKNKVSMTFLRKLIKP